jgi:hypothetical protein
MQTDNSLDIIRVPKVQVAYGDVEDTWRFIDEHKKNWTEIDLNDKRGIVIIGANGSGKSKFGAWIESGNEKVHRISSLRNLTFKELIPMEGAEEARRKITTGQTGKPATEYEHYGCFIPKWSEGKTSKQIDDYDHTLAFLMAEEANVAIKFKEDYSKTPAEERKCLECESAFDRLRKI